MDASPEQVQVRLPGYVDIFLRANGLDGLQNVTYITIQGDRTVGYANCPHLLPYLLQFDFARLRLKV